jgi:hypothetical protein
MDHGLRGLLGYSEAAVRFLFIRAIREIRGPFLYSDDLRKIC